MQTIKTIKIILLGNSNAGKTSILNRYMTGTFRSHISSTIGVDYRQKKISINNENINLFLYDTAGQERFYAITTSYIRSVHCVIVVFDLTDRSSFDNLEHWVEEIVNKNDIKNVVVFFAGNKCDRMEDVEVEENEIKEKIKNILKNGKYYQTSAKTGEGIEKMFEDIVKKYINVENEIDNKDMISLDKHVGTEKINCCKG